MKTFLAAALLVVFAPVPAWAWWDTGHKVVCEIAWQELAPITKAAIKDLLGGEERSYADSCVWADEIKADRRYDWARPHHYINVQPGSVAIDLDRDCPPSPGCVVRAIDRHIASLRDPLIPRPDRLETLKFLGHFVADVHQPLHAGHAKDRGGNDIPVHFFGRTTNLHKVWDGEILDRTGTPWNEMARTLRGEITPEDRTRWRGKQPVDWAYESFQLAESCAYRKPSYGWKLGQDYVLSRLPTVQRQLGKAGIRLAETLNAVFSGESAYRTPAQPAESSYYTGTQELTGDELRYVLHRIISNHKPLTYGQVWDALQRTDEDPENSDNVILLYTQRSERKGRRDSGSGENDAWNREHVWPKSDGFRDERQPAYTDLHHLRPADKTVNSSRGHKDFDDGGEPHREASGARADKDSFEAPNAVKGAIARSIFYMAVRYEGDACEPDLTISEYVTQSDTPALGRLCTLVSWHRQHAVDGGEKRRNLRIQSLQGNRNPFIDHPEWVEAIWGDRCPER